MEYWSNHEHFLGCSLLGNFLGIVSDVHLLVCCARSFRPVALCRWSVDSLPGFRHPHRVHWSTPLGVNRQHTIREVFQPFAHPEGLVCDDVLGIRVVL